DGVRNGAVDDDGGREGADGGDRGAIAGRAAGKAAGRSPDEVRVGPIHRRHGGRQAVGRGHADRERGAGEDQGRHGGKDNGGDDEGTSSERVDHRSSPWTWTV